MKDLGPIEYTHSGWFVLCPVFLAFDDVGAVTVEERHWTMRPLFLLSETIQAAAISALSWIDPDYEPMFMFHRVRCLPGCEDVED